MISHGISPILRSNLTKIKKLSIGIENLRFSGFWGQNVANTQLSGQMVME